MLNKLVNFLSDENKDKDDEINKILMINHPLVETLRDILKVSYNFYIEGFEDTKSLLRARSYILQDSLHDDFVSEYYEFIKKHKNKIYTLRINTTLFEDDLKLKFIKRSDWTDDNVQWYVEDYEEEDLPF